MFLPAPASAEDVPPSATPPIKLAPTGYLETYYAYNFARPSNGITNYRGFDNRHDTFTISNAALGVGWEAGRVSGRIVLQVGATPSTYYLSEPSLAGTTSVNASGPELWKYVQEAYVGYRAPVGNGVLLQAGVFLSPIGPEVIPVKDNWNWSRSNMFFGLPFYHTGARATYELGEAWSISAGIYNGWNSVVDNNGYKSLSALATYKIPGRLLAQLLYFGGVERSRDSLVGSPWRHLFDAYARWDALDWLSALLHLDAGMEPGAFGTATWYTTGLYARVRVLPWLFGALRGDRFHEHVPASASGATSPIFWGGAGWVSSLTATFEARTAEAFSVRLEYRHDQADGPLYFRGRVSGLGTLSSPFVPNSTSQDTITVGMTAWF